MKFLSGYVWREEPGNDLSLLLHQTVTKRGEVLFSCVCRGIGKAPAYAARQLTEWFYREGVFLCKGGCARVAGSLGEEVRRTFVQLCDHTGRAAEETLSLAGALAAGGRIWLLGAGGTDCACFVVNSRFDRPHVGELRICGEKTDEEKAGREEVGREKAGWEDVGREKAGREEVGGKKTGRAEVGGEKAGGEKAGRAEVGGEKAGREESGRAVVAEGILQRKAGLLLTAGGFGAGVEGAALARCLAEEITSQEQIGRRLREIRRAGQDRGAAVFFKAV